MAVRWVIVALVALAVAGCNLNLTERGDPAPPSALDGAPDELQQLRAEAGMLKTRLNELGGRNLLLAEELTKLKFLNEQLRKQLLAVGDAPRQRDDYRKRLARQEILIKRLEARIAELEGRPRPVSPPTSMPKRED